MTKNMKLVLGASTVALFAITALQGCGSDSDSSPGAGAPGAGAPSAGAGGAKGGASGAGAPGAGAPGAGAPSAGAGGGAAAGAGGTGGGAAAGAGGTGGAAAGTGGTGGAAAGAGGAGGAALTCMSNDPFPGMGETCATYCANYETTCQANVTGGWTNDKYATKAACLTDCMNNFGYTGADIQSAICCRGYHVKNAAMGTNDDEKKAAKNTHCPHAAGKALCK